MRRVLIAGATKSDASIAVLAKIFHSVGAVCVQQCSWPALVITAV